MRTLEYRVLIQTSDERDEAADRIEALVRRALHREWDAGNCYVERVVVPHERGV